VPFLRPVRYWQEAATDESLGCARLLTLLREVSNHRSEFQQYEAKLLQGVQIDLTVPTSRGRGRWRRLDWGRNAVRRRTARRRCLRPRSGSRSMGGGWRW
jgi:hypothetical protein